jgi:hypothetical protein
MEYPELATQVTYAVYWFDCEKLAWEFMADYPTLAEANDYVRIDTVSNGDEFPDGQHWAIIEHHVNKKMLNCFTSKCEAKFTPIVSGTETVV